MASLTDAPVAALLEAPNHAVISTLNDEDGSILSAVARISLEEGTLAVNRAEGRRWPTNLDRDSRVTVVVIDQANPYEYVEIRGTARGAPRTPTTTSTGWPASTSARTPTRSAPRERSGAST